MKSLKINLALSFVSFLAMVSFSQEYKSSDGVIIKNGEPYEYAYGQKFFYKVNNELIAISYSGKNKNEFTFQKFDNANLNEIKKITQTLDNLPFNYSKDNPNRLMAFLNIWGKLQMLYKVVDSKNEIIKIYAYEIDLDKGGFIGQPTLILEIDNKGDTYNSFSFDVIDLEGENNDIIMIRYEHLIENNFMEDILEIKPEMGFTLFNINWNKISEHEVIISNELNSLSVFDFVMDSNGNGYYLIKKNNQGESQNKKSKKENFSLSIIKFDKDGFNKEFKVSLNENIISQVRLCKNLDDDIFCTGYYKKPKDKVIDGVFVSVINKNGIQTETKSYEFPLEFIKEYQEISERNRQKLDEQDKIDNVGINDLELNYGPPHFLSDGSIIITGQVYYTKQGNLSKQGNSQLISKYENIVLTKINSNGELNFMKTIPQKSFHSSLRMIESKDYIYVIFEDNPENAELKVTESASNKYPTSSIVAYRVNIIDGTHKYLTLFDRKEINNIQFSLYNSPLKEFLEISGNEFIIELATDDKKNLLFQIEFEE